MKKFLVMYMAPVSVIDEWMKSDPETRKEAEVKMQADWKNWTAEHAKMFDEMPAGVGKTKRITSEGTKDVRNDMMLYSIVEGASHEEVAKAFENHPHLGISQASIEIMELGSPMGSS